MIEKTVKDYLKKTLSVSVLLEKQPDIPKEYILIEKVGSGEENHIKNATKAIQSFGERLIDAAELNERVKKVMKNIIALDEITKCKLNSDYNYTDSREKTYRYQAIFDITHY